MRANSTPPWDTKGKKTDSPIGTTTTLFPFKDYVSLFLALFLAIVKRVEEQKDIVREEEQRDIVREDVGCAGVTRSAL
jgi:hypothetical protein